MPTRSLKLILRRCPDTARLLRHSARLEKATRAIRARLPAPLAARVQVAHLDSERAVVVAESSAWLAQLIYFRSVLERSLGPGTGKSLRVELRVLPRSTARETRRQAEAPGKAARASLRSAASNLGDSPLAAALRRLAER